MKTLSKLALAALLSTGMAGAVAVAPAAAQKGKKDQGPKINPAALKAAQTAQPAIAAKDFATAEPAVAALEAAALSDYEKYVAAALRYDLESQKIYAQRTANPNAPVDESVLIRPIDVLLANANTPATDKPRYAYRRGALAYNAKQWPVAIQYLTQAQQLGYNEPELPLQIVQAKVNSGDVQGANADLLTAIDALKAQGKPVPEDYYRYAIGRSNARKLNTETLAWLKRYAQAYPTAKNWRDVVMVYGIQQNPVAVLDKNQKIDLFRLLRAANALADQYDYEEYAQNVLDRGLPSEAQAVIKEGQASGKVPATSGNARQILADATSGIRNEGSLSGTETRARAGADGKLAAQTADAYLGQGNWAKSADLYRVALTKGGVNADEVNTRLGIALARSGDKAGATAAFGQVKAAPRVDIAQLWTTWLATTA